MTWKDFPNWFKGIIFVFLFLVVYTLIGGLILAIIQGGECGGMVEEMYPSKSYPGSFIECFYKAFDIYYLPTIIPGVLFPFIPFLYPLAIVNNPTVQFIYCPLAWIAIGALIGWIVGKIKSKK